jgi:hypothetical protein
LQNISWRGRRGERERERKGAREREGERGVEREREGERGREGERNIRTFSHFTIFIGERTLFPYSLLFTHQASLPHAYVITSCGVRYCVQVRRCRPHELAA